LSELPPTNASALNPLYEMMFDSSIGCVNDSSWRG